MSQPFRFGPGELIDRERPLAFTFDGRHYEGYAGDTLASALLAQGVRRVGRSFKYHRPRGILGAGVEEPNALVALGPRGRHRPNLRATEIPLYDGLEARGQNAWPSVRLDLGAIARVLGPILSAGFYYKTFMAPRWGWPFYERLIRKAAGLGEAPTEPDGRRSDKRHLFCDVLVIGAGPAGLMAARAAARAGARVILADERADPGGGLIGESARLDGLAAGEWGRRVADALAAEANVRVLPRTSVFGRYRHGTFGLVAQARAGEVYYSVRAQQAVLAAGAIERPLVFADNDRPGVMLAGAVRRYVRGHGVLPGRRAVVVTNNDSAYETARALKAAGAEVAAIVDLRGDAQAPPDLQAETLAGAIVSARGRRRLTAVDVDPRGGNGRGARRRIACDLLCVSGGWSPAVHLAAHLAAVDEVEPVFDERWGAFVPPAEGVSGLLCAGTCNGTDGLAAVLAEGRRAGVQAAAEAGWPADPRAEAASAEPTVEHPDGELSLRTAAAVEAGSGGGKRFIDYQNDVTVADLELALREGYRSIEHVKRYTTLGMGTDQGRTSNVNGLRVVAERLGRAPAEVGTTSFRPPYAPVPLGALAARESGPRLAPLRRSPMHDWHADHDAVFMPAGLWLRPQYYRSHGATLTEAARAEAANVRRNVGIADVSTLGKIELGGPDAATFLDRVYMNACGRVRPNRARYGVMLREDGFVFDDGTVARLADDRFLVTTTTANAGAVLSHLEFYQQMVWPGLDVRIMPVTEQWATVALAGPRSREVLARVFAGVEVGNEALPFLGVLETEWRGSPARIFRISFSGERAYEIAVAADHGPALWERLLDLGESCGIMPYGLEAMDYLRVEKGHLIVGADIDGRVTPHDLGMQALIRADGGFVGGPALTRAGLHDPDRVRLAGFVASDRDSAIPAGAQLVARPDRPAGGSDYGASLGRITSPAFSPALERPIALGLVVGGATAGTLHAVSPVTDERTEVVATEPAFYDPAGERLRG